MFRTFFFANYLKTYSRSTKFQNACGKKILNILIQLMKSILFALQDINSLHFCTYDV